jgi:ankyrin repeat protein
MVEMLLSLSARVITHQKDTRGCTALPCVAEMSNDQITKMPVRSGADANGLDDEVNSPLHGAASKGRKANARLLLNANANIEAIDEEGIKSLRRASRTAMMM